MTTRRSYLAALLSSGAALAAPPKNKASTPIVLFVDMPVAPSRETEMVRTFHTVFKPTAEKHPGYIDVKIVKIEKALMGAAPPSVNYRFILVYESEALRQKWIASEPHIKAWAKIESTFTTKNYTVLLCQDV
jgi:heme-degrading monooxygenase HmoA